MIPDEAVSEGFRAQFGVLPELLAHAPGRVNLIGDHTDYNGGFVLPVAIEREIRIAARIRGDRVIRLYSGNFSSEVTIEVDRPKIAQGRERWGNYPMGIVAEFEARGVRVPGMEACLVGDVPGGAGLSSSAALEIAMAVLLNEASGAKLSRRELALLGQAAEHGPYVGVQCGIMDQYISAMAREGSALLIDCHTLDARQVPISPAACGILIINSNKRRGLVTSEYNQRRREAEEGLRLLKELSGGSYPSLRFVPADDYARHAEALPEVIRRRVRHVLTENALVLEFAEAIESGDMERAGSRMYASHVSLRDDYETSCEELDFVVECCKKLPAVYGCRITGGGFGGCAVALVRPGEEPAIEALLTSEYARRFGVEPGFIRTRAAGCAAVQRI